MLSLRTYLIKERVGFLKLVDTYDIFDPASGRQVGVAREKVPGYVHVLRFLVNKRLLPTGVEVREEAGGPVVVAIRRGGTLFRSKVRIFDGGGRCIGHFLSRVFSLGGAFDVFDAQGQKVAEVKGDWKGWNFTLQSADGRPVGTVTKKWGGVGRELFTSADNYVIAINDQYPVDDKLAALLLAAGLAIDIVYKEK